MTKSQIKELRNFANIYLGWKRKNHILIEGYEYYDDSLHSVKTRDKTMHCLETLEEEEEKYCQTRNYEDTSSELY